MVAATIYNLCGQPGEQRLRAFRVVNHVELAFCLVIDHAQGTVSTNPYV